MSVFSNTFFFSVISGNGGVSSLTSSGSFMGVVSSSISGVRMAVSGSFSWGIGVCGVQL